MASTRTPGKDLSTSEGRVIAFFRDKDDAYSAINQLRDAGFTSSEIGLMAGSEYESTGTTASTTRSSKDHDSFWQKVKDFFTGEHDEDYDYRETSSDLNWTDDRADYYYQGINAGGALVSVGLIGLNASSYFHNSYRALLYGDIVQGLTKPLFSGFIIATVGCYFGMNTKGGTQGVGKATTQAVVVSSVFIIVVDFIVSRVMIGIFGR